MRHTANLQVMQKLFKRLVQDRCEIGAPDGLKLFDTGPRRTLDGGGDEWDERRRACPQHGQTLAWASAPACA